MTPTKTRRPSRTYSDEFKNQLVQLYLNGKRKCDILSIGWLPLVFPERVSFFMSSSKKNKLLRAILDRWPPLED